MNLYFVPVWEGEGREGEDLWKGWALKITLKGLSHEIDFKNVVENGQILALIRAAAGS